ncbi:MAG: DUF433 domain-containing protein [Bacteroidetes bacterium]|nr:DUF433 domain-containing protein [Bacteroidota bacterium]
MKLNYWDIPMYNPTFVGRLVNLSTGRVKRWLEGYNYTYSVGHKNEIREGHKGPIITRVESDQPNYASFLDLIDLLFVNKFLNYGISLQRIRKALDEANNILGGHHFAQRNFFTDGKNIYLQVKEEADALLELLSNGQWVIERFIKELSHQIKFDEPTGFAKQWYPFGKNGLIVVDPKFSFGEPIIVGKGITTANVYDLYMGERRRINNVCSWLSLEEQEVKAAVSFETKLKAA